MFKSTLLCAAAVCFSGPFFPQDPAPAAADKGPIAWDGTVIQVLRVTDLEKSVRWYREVLGCELSLDLSEIGFCEMTTPVRGTLIGLSQTKEGEKWRGNGDSKISFGVVDIEAAQARLKRFGATDQDVVLIPETVKLLDFADPDGNNLMLHQAVTAKK